MANAADWEGCSARISMSLSSLPPEFRFKKERPLDWLETSWCICTICAGNFDPKEKKSTKLNAWYCSPLQIHSARLEDGMAFATTLCEMKKVERKKKYILTMLDVLNSKSRDRKKDATHVTLDPYRMWQILFFIHGNEAVWLYERAYMPTDMPSCQMLNTPKNIFIRVREWKTWFPKWQQKCLIC